MLTKIEINELFKKKARDITLCGEIFLSIDVACEFIEVCHQNNIAISGIEVFEIVGNNVDEDVRPFRIADYSSACSMDDWSEIELLCYKSSKRFIEALPQYKDYLISFTLFSREECEK